MSLLVKGHSPFSRESAFMISSSPHPPIGHVTRSSRPILDEADVVCRGEPAMADAIPSAGAAIAVPLELGGRTVGALAVARSDGNGPIDDTALRALRPA